MSEPPVEGPLKAAHARVAEYVEHSLTRNPTTKFLFEKLTEAGCVVDDAFIRLEKCNSDTAGGFRPPDGVVVCYNQIRFQEEVNMVLAHELIHAYDHCRAKNVDWHNCEHHACSEVRAANLSGDCQFGHEWNRGNFGLKGQHQTCVRRRAQLSVAMNPNCKGIRAKAAVDAAFPPCFEDTSPFDRIP